MEKTKHSSKRSRNFIFALIMIFIVGAGASYFYLKGKFSFDSSFITEIESRQANTTQKEQTQDTPRLYEYREASTGSDEKKEYAAAAAEDVVRKYFKTYKVRLLDLYMDGKGIVYIDLGDELKKNFEGDAFEELSIFAELYKRIEPVVPGFTALRILIEGHETETIGGHVDISKPLGKEIADNI